jgi:hypothetical protein
MLLTIDRIRYRTNSDWEMAVDGNQCLRVERNCESWSWHTHFTHISNLRSRSIVPPLLISAP